MREFLPLHSTSTQSFMGGTTDRGINNNKEDADEDKFAISCNLTQ